MQTATTNGYRRPAANEPRGRGEGPAVQTPRGAAQQLQQPLLSPPEDRICWQLQQQRLQRRCSNNSRQLLSKGRKKGLKRKEKQLRGPATGEKRRAASEGPHTGNNQEPRQRQRRQREREPAAAAAAAVGARRGLQEAKAEAPSMGSRGGETKKRLKRQSAKDRALQKPRKRGKRRKSVLCGVGAPRALPAFARRVVGLSVCGAKPLLSNGKGKLKRK
ncbi:hypothetical protein EBH_0017410 [Eimeria brunetti]|uniref:Uncharacterized protein n=1 Tax=Eimeria brunetti TaxID=51314 RepID=U6LB98_9EIME|nr:hypothetical protein EBH_0017410 [Eimeria brunetti]